MANIKRVQIHGIAPFDLHEHPPIQPMLAFIVSPASGLRLHWKNETTPVPNKHGGRTAMFCFSLTGDEAVRWEWLDAFKKHVQDVGGTITEDSTFDLEAASS